MPVLLAPFHQSGAAGAWRRGSWRRDPGGRLAARGARQRPSAAGGARKALSEAPSAALEASPAQSAAARPRHVYLIDGSGFIFRAYHALPWLNRSDGTPTTAVHPFTNMLLNLLPPSHPHPTP